jgi:hypothetical protein
VQLEIRHGHSEKEILMALFDDVKKNLMEWYTVTSEKTNDG